MESYHGTHALAWGRQGSTQEQLAALSPHFKLTRPTHWYRNPKNEAHPATAKTGTQNNHILITLGGKNNKQPSTNICTIEQLKKA